jgi:hypothetical protein
MKKYFILLLTLSLSLASFAQWTQKGLTIYGTNDNENTGIDIELSENGNTIIVGASGGWNASNVKVGWVKVYTFNGSTWIQKGQTLYGVNLYDGFGGAVSINASGDTIAMGAKSYDPDGMAKVFYYTGSSWSQLGPDFTPEVTVDRIGSGVSLSDNGTRFALGAYANDGGGTSSGHVRIFEWSGGTWNQLGQDIDGAASNDWTGFYHTLSGDGNTVVVDGWRNDLNGVDAGRAAAYRYNGSSWNQLGPDFLGDAAADRLGVGTAVSYDGNIIALGADEYPNPWIDSGYVRIYEWSGVNWNQLGSTLRPPARESFGRDLSLSNDGHTLIVGSTNKTRIFDFNGTDWIQRGLTLTGSGLFGTTVHMNGDGNTIVAGAQSDNTNGNSNGAVWIYEWACTETSSIISPTACETYTSPSGNYVSTISNTFNDTIPNSAGCDSIITINLTILPAKTGTHDETVCFGDSIIINNITYDATNLSGIEVFTNVGQYQCDSTVTVNLTILQEKIGAHNGTICFGESIVINGTTYDANNLSGIEVFSNIGPNQCDSTVIVNLSIEAINTNTSIVNYTMIAELSNANYQWIDCSSNLEINGATDQIYEATQNGEYAVVVTNGICTDTSDCILIEGLSTHENESNNFEVYPNPSIDGLFKISADVSLYTLELYDSQGRKVEVSINLSTGVIDGRTLDQGNYQLKITTDTKLTYFKQIIILK